MVGRNTPPHPTSLDILLRAEQACPASREFGIAPGEEPKHGTLKAIVPVGGSSARVTYTPHQNYVREDEFWFYVREGAWESGWARGGIYVVPGPVLAAECGYGWIKLTWDITAIEQTFGAIGAGFNVYRATAAGGPYTLLTPQPLGPAVRRYVDSALAFGLPYYYVVTFLNHEPDPITPNAWLTYESPFSNERQVSTCPPPRAVATDVAFIVDNTGSIGDLPLAALRREIAAVLNDIEVTSGTNYSLALVTPDEDQVHVRLPFTPNNRGTFVVALNANLDVDGMQWPESTDECLDTILEAWPAANRPNPKHETCAPRSDPPQIGDFTPGFRDAPVRKLVVIITDHGPGGFCDSSDDGAQAAIYAGHARTKCVRINAVQVDNHSDATDVMLNCRQATCGWYKQIPATGVRVTDAVVQMLDVPGYCNCP